MTRAGNLYTLFESRFPARRDAVFMQTPQGERLSFAWLEDQVARFSGALRVSGVRPGDRVAAQVDNCPDVVPLYLACLRSGAIYVPLNTAYTDVELAFLLKDAQPALFITRSDRLETAAGFEQSVPGLRVLSLDKDGTGTFLKLASEAEPAGETVARKPGDTAAILYTSGTTGRPKGAMLTHENLASNALALHEAWGFRQGDVLLHALPLYHTHGLFVAVNIMLLNGGKMILLPRFDPSEVMRLMPSATVFMGVPTFYTRLLGQEDFGRDIASGVRLFVSGSAPLLEDTFREFERRTGHQILERYGMTETCMNCSNPLEGDRRPGTVGKPLPGVEVRVCDREGNVPGPGKIGVLEVRGPNVFSGYWRMPGKSAEEFRKDGYFITGDLARISSDGYVTIVGRDKDLVISGGLNVYPREVEEVIDGLPGIKESAVIGVPHPDFGEAVAAAVVADAERTPQPSAETIIRSVSERLANFKIPKKIFFLDELPRNAMGKVQKNALRERYKGVFSDLNLASSR